MPRMRLNDEVIASLRYDGNQQRIKDDLIPRLYLQVNKKSKSWLHQEVVNGKDKRFTLGKFPAMTTEEARQASLAFTPERHRENKIKSLTICELFETYLDKHASKTRSYGEITRYYCRFIEEDMDGVFVSTLKRIDVEDWFNDISKNSGPTMANRALQYLKAAFNWGLSRDLVEINPCMGVKANKEESRKRFLSASEMTKFMAGLKVLQEVHRDIVKVLLFTGQRKSQVLSMRWDDLNLDEELWFAEVKGGRQVTVPLSSKVIDILKRRLSARKEGKSFVFYQHGRKDSHVKSMEVAWNKLREHTGLYDLRMHDLRRTLASWQVIGGESMRVVQDTLTHQSQSSTQIYAHLNNETVRDSVERTVDRMLSSDD